MGCIGGVTRTYGGEFYLTGEVVEVPEERCEDLPVTGTGLGADCVDAVLGEVRVED